MKNIILVINLIIIICFSGCKLVDNTNSSLPEDDKYFDMRGHVNTVKGAYQLTIDDNYLFVGDGENHLSTYDAYVPWNMSMLSTIIFKQALNGRIYESVRDWRNNLYAACGKDGFYIFNTSNPSTPTVIDFNNNVKGKSIDMDNDLIAITTDNGWNLYTINSSNSLSLSYSKIFFEKEPRKIRIKYPYLYVSSETDLEIYDITMVSSPLSVRIVDLNDMRDMKIIDNYLISITNNQLIFIDIIQPYAAYMVQDIDLSNFSISPTAFSIQGNKLIIASDDMKLHYFILNSLESIVERGYKTFDYYIYDIDFSDDYYYLSCGPLGIYSLQINNVND